MLTARADEESKIKGLDFGADDYLVKPFNMDELQIKVKNIMARRRLMQEKIWKLFVTAPEETEVASANELFLVKLKAIIEQRMADPQLSVESLSEDMALSRVQLYRKVLSLTGVSGNKLIQSIRLQKAAQLLEKNTGPISEIAYQTGFNSLSYFTKCFKKKFGKTPSEFAFQAN